MKANATIRLKLSSKNQLKTIVEALEPEIKKPPTMRSRVRLEKDDIFLILRIEAKDTVALRATANAYLRWINSMVNILEVLQNSSEQTKEQ